jgi:uncharacterized membrane protein YdjX (TVP38/TMEM64 family)
MSHKATETAAHVVHVALHTEAGKHLAANAGTALAATATTLLATPLAPVVLGGAVVYGTWWGLRKLIDWIDS